MRMNVITLLHLIQLHAHCYVNKRKNNTEKSIMLSAMTRRDPNTSRGSAQNMNIMDYKMVVVFNVVG